MGCSETVWVVKRSAVGLLVLCSTSSQLLHAVVDLMVNAQQEEEDILNVLHAH